MSFSMERLGTPLQHVRRVHYIQCELERSGADLGGGGRGSLQASQISHLLLQPSL